MQLLNHDDYSWLELGSFAFHSRNAPNPAQLCRNLRTSKSVRQGFAQMFGHISRCLEMNRVPDERGVRLTYESGPGPFEEPFVTKTFLQRGGTIASAATTVFQDAVDQDELARTGDAYETHKDDLDELPRCRNDHEFGFVMAMCGYDPQKQRLRLNQ